MGLISRVSSRTYRVKLIYIFQKKMPKYELPKLPYAYDALEPHICGEIMELHHSKHHQAYVNKLNMLTEQMEKAKNDNDQVTIDKINYPLKFNYGGHINHTFFWDNMSPNGGGDCPEGPLKDQIIKDFGSVEKMQTDVSAATCGVMGSGWGWLGYDQKNKCLKVATTMNQDLLEEVHGLKPLVGIDVWEHAYYLQYKNVRPDYVKHFWNVINWSDVVKKFAAVV